MINSIHSDLIRGHIDTIILSVLHEGDRYGYDILGEIEKKSDGEYALKQPTLYSCLKRLETQGFIYKYWGTETNGGRRTYYSLTEMGKELFQKNKDDWVYSREVINKLIDTGGETVAFIPRDKAVKDPIADAEVTEIADTTADAEEKSDDIAATETDGSSVAEENSYLSNEAITETAETREIENKTEVIDEQDIVSEQTDETDEVEATEHEYTKNDAYADVIADAEIEALAQYNYAEEATYNADDSINGYCYADRRTNDNVPKNEFESFGTSLFAKDYSEELDEEEYEELADNDADDEQEDAVEEDLNEEDADYPAASFYSDDDFNREQSDYYDATNELPTSAQEDREFTQEESIFRHYNDSDLSEDTDREITVNREYRKVISELLSGDSEEEYFEALKKAGEEYYAQPASEPTYTDATADYDSQYQAKYYQYEQHADAVTAEKTAVYSKDGGSNKKKGQPGQANFDELTVAVRSMGDDVRIRTHSADAQKEYNNIYHYYSNKLSLFKYGILFAIMLLEIIIPYTVIKFGAKLYIAGEIPVLVVSVIFAAIFPIYSAVAYLVDPYKRKRFNYNMKSSLLYRTGIMLLLLVLTYTANVVFMMDIAFEVDYLFSLITPALLSTNVPLASLIFKKLYDSKKFAVES